MSGHDPWVSVREMADYAQEAVDMVSGIGRKDLDRKTGLALAHLAEIVGEAGGSILKYLSRA